MFGMQHAVRNNNYIAERATKSSSTHMEKFNAHLNQVYTITSAMSLSL